MRNRTLLVLLSLMLVAGVIAGVVWWDHPDNRERRLSGADTATLMEKAALSPDSEPVLYELAKRMEEKGVWEEAEKYYVRAGQGKPERARGWVQASRLAERRNDPVQAIEYAQEGTRRQSGAGEAYLRLGEVYRKLGAWDRSLDALKEAQRLEPENAQVWDSLAMTYLERKLFSDAEQASRTAIRLQPGRAEYYLRLSSALRQMNRLTDAQEAAETALKLSPDLPEALTERGTILTLAARSQEDLQKAEGLFRKAVQRLAGDAQSYAPTIQLGQLLLSQRRYHTAEEQFRRALQIRPDDIAAGFALSRTLQLMGRKQEAQTLLLKFQRESDYRQTARELNMRLAREPDRVDLANALGDLHEKHGDLSSAVISWQRSLKINPDQPSIRARMEAAQKQLANSTSIPGSVIPE
jgi:tetratricopeptide (TPR) repeat protein